MRAAVIGSSGAGKSTLARKIANAAGVAYVELDALNWGPGWLNRSAEDPEGFRRRVEAAAASEAWVTCGNYRLARAVLLPRLTHLVWLDYARPVVMARVIRRSLARAATGRELWPGTGNREDFRRWLDPEHPIRWAWDTFARRRRDYAALFADPALAHVSKHRLRHPREAGSLVARLAREAQSYSGANTGTGGPPSVG